VQRKAKIYIGTSGYQYYHWRGLFYPENLISYKWLEYYAKFFKTVELNVTFYRLPPESAFKGWSRRTPKDFIFVLKGSRFITHVKKLNNIREATKLFFDRAKLLKEKLGIVLWQLPPGWKVNADRLEKFLKFVSKDKIRQAFEFRNETWFCSEVYKLLKKYRAGLVIADSPYYPKIEKITANFVYLRFHGGRVLYGSEYSKKELTEWAKKIKKWLRRGLDVYVYFNNDANAYAVKNARELVKLLNG